MSLATVIPLPTVSPETVRRILELRTELQRVSASLQSLEDCVATAVERGASTGALGYHIAVEHEFHRAVNLEKIAERLGHARAAEIAISCENKRIRKLVIR